MKRGAAVILLVAGLVAAGSFLRRDAAAPSPAPPPPPLPEGWLGSDGCATCHAEIHARWSRTTHALTLRDFSEKTSARAFDGAAFEARGREYRMGPGPVLRADGPGGEEREFPVDMVIGARRVQMFTTTLDGGRVQVLPVFLEVPTGEWFHYTDFIFGMPRDYRVAPDGEYAWYGFHRNFNSRCGECHTTGYDVGYDPDRGAYETRWEERSVSCESCHGPGAAHAAYRRRGGRGGPDPILNPARPPAERANQVCGACHAEAHAVMPGFSPGDDLFAFRDVAGLEDERHLWADGRPRELIHTLVQTMESRCSVAGADLSCGECHDPHGTEHPGDTRVALEDDAMCTKCHRDRAREAHTHHAPESPGSRCVNCHMPPMVIEGGHGVVRDHTISIPSPAASDRYGLPNACRTCHLAEPPGWHSEHFDRWYPGAEERNHRTALAAAIGGGRRGDPRAEAALRELLRSDEPAYRAAAARLLAAYSADLRAQLDDEHPMVRRAAIPAVARTHPEALVPLLDDENHVLRLEAARALAARPLDETVASRVVSTLRAFAQVTPDRPELHRLLGDLLRARRRFDEARKSYDRYLLLQPWDEGVRARRDGLPK